MAVDRRQKNANWHVLTDEGRAYSNYDSSHLAVLMDIRDELQTLNAVFRCGNFLAIPHTLKAIQRNTAWSRKRRLTADKRTR